MPRTQKYYRRRYGGAYRSAPPPRRTGPGAGCIKIIKGPNRIRIWNNCREPLVIEPGNSLVIEIVNTVRYQLDYTTAVAIYGEPAQEAPRPRERRAQEDDYAGAGSDSYYWV